MVGERRRPLDIERLLTTFARHELRYLVVGGMAAILHGWPGATADLDILGDFAPDNLERLTDSLTEIGATAEGWDGTAGSLAAHTAWSFDTDAGPVDVLFVLEPSGTYEDLRPASEAVPAFGAAIPVVSLDDLIDLKQALGRPKDLRVALELDDLRRQSGR